MKNRRDDLTIKEGDTVQVTRDDGTKEIRAVTSDPWQLGGHTWVVMLEGISGCYQLSRCRKLKFKPLGAEMTGS